ncbi:hypothetical protein [Thalassospira sp. MCCC 1A01428]|uniref:hypothetical protein n=1 Tax=Thalassospira sp. MCCC 1A01428 TaxID=1470575 RepID=UPI000A1F67C5|nr:hypothetical protein [Thalassospira sp. MCCC 1A01428]OSQ41667.1 hypothetical protein THS27_18315 [Thalassospira sp. MCCC 1A01428]
MEYPVLITVSHDGKTVKPGSMVDLTSEQAGPLIRGGFIGNKAPDATVQIDADFAPVDNAAPDEPASELDRLIKAIGKLDSNKADLFTGSGKPKTEALQEVNGIDFTVSAALRDQAWDQFHKQKIIKNEG